mmetsp:Transcript_691/g.2761  ORF Transcript_691/g.2761 Transcript_691/m.2761 type:complete len:225 (+) Transcript_691:184-858(+)
MRRGSRGNGGNGASERQGVGQRLLRAVDAHELLLRGSNGADGRRRGSSDGLDLLRGQGRDSERHHPNDGLLLRRSGAATPSHWCCSGGRSGVASPGAQRRGRHRRAPHPGPAGSLHDRVGAEGRLAGRAHRHHARRPQARPHRPLPGAPLVPVQSSAQLCRAAWAGDACLRHRCCDGCRRGGGPVGRPLRRAPGRHGRAVRHPGAEGALRNAGGGRCSQGLLHR